MIELSAVTAGQRDRIMVNGEAAGHEGHGQSGNGDQTIDKPDQAKRGTQAASEIIGVDEPCNRAVTSSDIRPGSEGLDMRSRKRLDDCADCPYTR
jgi:hypothetical protein